MPDPKFTRTATAAQSDRLSKWDLIAAIAADATEAGLPITGIHAVLAAKAALDAAGNEYADSTVKDLCVVAKFDHESTPAQRRVWRRYGWTTVRLVAKAGWSPETAADLLGGERKSRREVTQTVGQVSGPGTTEKPPEPFDDRCAEAVGRLQKVLRDLAALAAEAEELPTVGALSAMGLALYYAINEKVIDAEYRQLIEGEDVR